MANEDLRQMQDKLAAWAGKIPPAAVEFHRCRTALEKQIRDSTGAFGSRNSNQIAEIVRKAQELEGVVPALMVLFENAGRARNQVIEFQAAQTPDTETRSLVDNWTGEWLDLMEFLLSRTSDNAAAQKASAQVKQIETWAADRKDALSVLSKMAALRAGNAGPGLNEALDSALRYWKEEFAAERTDAKWVARASATAGRLMAERVTETPSKPAQPSRSEGGSGAAAQPMLAPEPKKTSEGNGAPTRQPPASQPAAEGKEAPAMAASVRQPLPVAVPAESPEDTGSGTQFFSIGLVLAECHDLVGALEEPAAEFEQLDERFSQLHNREQVSAADIHALEQKIQSYLGELQKLADLRVKSRLQQLRARWQCFQEVYGERPEIAAIVAQAEAAHPDSSNRLREFLRNVNDAGQLINSMANAYRPKLAEYVGARVEECRSAAARLADQPRLIAVDEAMRKLKIPKPPDSRVSAEELFELLDESQALRARIAELTGQNEARKNLLRELAARLVNSRSQIASLSGDGGANLPQVPLDLPADRSLEATEAELKGTEKLLNVHSARVQQELTRNLQKARRENKAWIKLVVPFVPEVASCASPDQVVEDLLELRDAVETENRHRERIGELSSVASRQVAARRSAVAERLELHLKTPAFETHPERETAEELLQALHSAKTLAEPPEQQGFRGAMLAVIGSEDFIDRIESAQREIRDGLAVLQESYVNLQDLNGTAYRKDLAKRLNTLITGARRGIELEQWEHLPWQLGEANRVLAALKRDALRQIGSETDELVEKLEYARKNSHNDVLIKQIESAFEAMKELRQFEPPPWSLRRQMLHLDRRTVRR